MHSGAQSTTASCRLTSAASQQIVERPLAVLLLMIVLVSAGPRALARQWVDNTGTHSVQAEFVERRGDDVLLRKTNGKVITVPLARLSLQDQEFVRRTLERQDADRTAEPTQAIAPITPPPTSTRPPTSADPPPTLETSRSQPSSLDVPDSPEADTSTPNASPDTAEPSNAVTVDLPAPQPPAASDSASMAPPLSSANETVPVGNIATHNQSLPSDVVAGQTTTGFWVRVSLLVVCGMLALGLGPLVISLLLSSVASLLLAYFDVLPAAIGFEAGLAGAYLLAVATISIMAIASGDVDQEDYWFKAVGPSIVVAVLAFFISWLAVGTAWIFVVSDACVAGALFHGLSIRAVLFVKSQTASSSYSPSSDVSSSYSPR